VISPDIDESTIDGESATTQVQRLALAKAQAVAVNHPDSLIIGSDQLANCNDTTFGKPGSHAEATRQLKQMRGNTLLFFTGICLLNSNDNVSRVECVEYRVHFRHFSDQEIERYLIAEQPYNCAASFKSEALGISLVESMEGPDPSALIGLPLLKLAAMLRQEKLLLP
jgi:MAF protein